MEHRSFTVFFHCPELVVQFGSISGLFAAIHVRLIFSSCFSAYHAFVYLEDSKRVPAWLRCPVIFLCMANPRPLLSSDLGHHLFFLGFC